MKRSLKYVTLAVCTASALLTASCSNFFDKSGMNSSQSFTLSRSVVSSSNGSINVNGMSNGNLSVSYNAGSKKSFVRLYVTEGNGKGLVLANQDMNYSNGVYSYTFSNHTFTSGAVIGICVLVNDNGAEKCIPQGNLASSASWSTVVYGTDTSTGTPSTQASSIESGSTYSIISKVSGRSLDADAWGTKNGDNVIQWDFGGNQSNQQWRFESVGGGYFKIINVNSGLCLDVSDVSFEDRANVHQWEYVGGANQMWAAEKLEDGYYRLVNKNSGKVLDVDSGSKDNGANIQQYTWNGTDAQRWAITKVTASAPQNPQPSNPSGGSLMSGATNGTSVGTNGFRFIGQDSNFDTLVWSDEFEGNSLNRSNWTFDTGNSGWGNSELENYTAGNNVTVGNGVLTIHAKNDLTSSRLKTVGLKEFQYGKIEARLKCSQGTGSWPAFWMLGTGSNYQWPYCGEIDIMEHANNDKFTFATAHWNASGKNTSTPYSHAQWGQTTDNNYWNVISNLNVSEWHTYGIEWTAQQIRWYVDGKQVMACDIGDSSNGTDAFNAPYYILLNFAMGGQFTGIYSASQFNGLPWEMNVDYVRVYQ